MSKLFTQLTYQFAVISFYEQYDQIISYLRVGSFYNDNKPVAMF